MDRLIIAEKLEGLRRCVKRIEEKKPPQLDILINDADIQDIVVLNLTRAVQLCVDIGSHIISETNENAPQTMGDVFTILEKLKAIDLETSRKMKKAVGFRNVAIHNYQAISWEIVYAICDKSLDDFRNFAKSIHLYSTQNG